MCVAWFNDLYEEDFPSLIFFVLMHFNSVREVAYPYHLIASIVILESCEFDSTQFTLY